MTEPEQLPAQERFYGSLASMLRKYDRYARQDAFRGSTPEEFRQRMENGSMRLWVAEDAQRLAGVFTVVYPGISPINYGWKLNLPPEDLVRVVNMDTAAVHSDYRGQGLQRRLMETAERELGPGKILLCTIHPDNRYSLRNALTEGYEIQATLPMYGSVRHLLRKDSK